VEGIGPKRAATIMKVYENTGNIAATDPAEIAERCRISQTVARAVHAAAKLALEDRQTEQKRLLSRGQSLNTAELAAEAAADTEYNTDARSPKS